MKRPRKVPSDYQLAILLGDWMIMPNSYRIDLIRVLLIHRRGCHVLIIISYMRKRGHIIDDESLTKELIPFFRRKLLRTIKGVTWKGASLERYMISNPWVKNPVYFSFFKKLRVPTSRRRRHDKRFVRMTLMQY